jgi:hypothetical protein
MITRCEACGLVKQTKYISLGRNVGMIFVRQTMWKQGYLCKNCINSYFWRFTIISLFFGWWGIISFFYNFYVLLNNILQYLSSIKFLLDKRNNVS